VASNRLRVADGGGSPTRTAITHKRFTGRSVGTARLMRTAGVQGVKRSKKAFATKAGPAAVKPADLVQRKFHAVAPCRLWVADIT